MNTKTQPDSPEEIAKRVRSTLDSLEYIRRYTKKPRMEIQQLQMIMCLSLYPEGISMQELAKRMGTDPSFVSRNVKSFGAQSDCHIIDQRIDYENPRQRIVSLSVSGWKMMATARGILRHEQKMPRIPPIEDARKQK